MRPNHPSTAPRRRSGPPPVPHRHRPPHPERLEGRTLLATFLFNPAVTSHIFDDREAVAAFVRALDGVVFNDALGRAVPLVGSFFKDVVHTTADLMTPIADDVGASIDRLARENFTTTQFEDALAGALQPVLKGLTQVAVVPGTDGKVDRIEYELTLGGPLVAANLPADFDLSLPALGLSLDADVRVNADYTIRLGLGLDANGYYLATGPSRSAAALHVTVAAPGLHAVGGLGPMQIEATDQAGPEGRRTGFEGTFTASLGDGSVNGGNDSLETLRLPGYAGTDGELDDLRVDTTVNGQADLHLAARVGVLDPAAGFPSLLTDFNLKWAFEDSTVPEGDALIGFGRAPEVAFDRVRLDGGAFFREFVGPVLGRVHDVLEPLQPLITALDSRVPVLSDVGFLRSYFGVSDVTLLDVIRRLDTGSTTEFFEAIVSANRLVQSIPRLDGTLDLGSVSLLDNGIDARVAGDQAKPIRTAVVEDVLANLAMQNPNARDFVEELHVGAGFSGGGVQFPVLQEPKAAFETFFLGRRDTTLFTLDLPRFEASAALHLSFPLLGILGVDLRGMVDDNFTAIRAAAHLAFGYDTHGLQQVLEYANDTLVYHPERLDQLADGFYVNTADTSFRIDAGIGAFAAVNALVFAAGVGGFIGGNVEFRLHDPTPGDGKVRGRELDELARRGLDYIFDTTGSLVAGLSAFVQVGIELPLVGFLGYRQTFRIAQATLADFSARPPDPPALATLGPDGVLTLNVGPNAPARGTPENPAGDDAYTVTHVRGDATSGEYLDVAAFGFRQRYGPVRRIAAIGGANDTIDVAAGVLVDAELTGGPGGNHLYYRGAGNATIVAHGTGNEVVGGSGQNTLSSADGGSWLMGGPGHNVLYAGPAGDTLQAGPNGDVLVGGPGPDVFVPGAGADTVYAGPGGDIVTWEAERGDGSPGAGPTRILAAPGDDVLLNVAGSSAADVIDVAPIAVAIDPSLPQGLLVVVNGMPIVAGGVARLGVAGRGGADLIHVADLAAARPELRSVGINTDELSASDGALDVVTLDGPATDTDLSVTTPGRDVPANPPLVPFVVAGLGPQFVVGNSSDRLVVNLGPGSNTATVETRATAARRVGQPYGTLVVNTGPGPNAVDVRACSGPTWIGGPGANTFVVGSLAPATGGVLAGVRGALTLVGGGSTSLVLDDSGNRLSRSGTLVASRLSGFGMAAAGITYQGFDSLDLLLGPSTSPVPGVQAAVADGGSIALQINVVAGQALPAATRVAAGTGDRGEVAASFGGELAGALTLSGFEKAGLSVGGDLSGVLTIPDVHGLESATIGGSIPAGGGLASGRIGTLTLGGDLAGAVEVDGAIDALRVGGETTGRVRAGTLGEVALDGPFTGAFVSLGDVRGTIHLGGTATGVLAVGGNLGWVDRSGEWPTRVGGLETAGAFGGRLIVLGDVLGDLAIGGDLRGRIGVRGRLAGDVAVNGSIAGTGVIVAGGAIGDGSDDTSLTAARNDGLIAARGPVRQAIPEGDGVLIESAEATEADAIDAIFTDSGAPLGLDPSLAGLALILADLDALGVMGGHLVGPQP